jgi:hypothetical protein
LEIDGSESRFVSAVPRKKAQPQGVPELRPLQGRFGRRAEAKSGGGIRTERISERVDAGAVLSRQKFSKQAALYRCRLFCG